MLYLPDTHLVPVCLPLSLLKGCFCRPRPVERHLYIHRQLQQVAVQRSAVQHVCAYIHTYLRCMEKAGAPFTAVHSCPQLSLLAPYPDPSPPSSSATTPIQGYHAHSPAAHPAPHPFITPGSAGLAKTGGTQHRTSKHAVEYEPEAVPLALVIAIPGTSCRWRTSCTWR